MTHFDGLLDEVFESSEVLRSDAESATLRGVYQGQPCELRVVRRCNVSVARMARFAQVCGGLQPLAFEGTVVVPQLWGRTSASRPFVVSPTTRGRLSDVQGIQPMATIDSFDLLRRVAVALASLHAIGIVHGSVHPSTIVLGAEGWSLTEIGFVQQLGLSGLMVRRGDYASPAVRSGAVWTEPDDLYAFGVLAGLLVHDDPVSPVFRLTDDCRRHQATRRPSAEALLARLDDARASVLLREVGYPPGGSRRPSG